MTTEHTQHTDADDQTRTQQRSRRTPARKRVRLPAWMQSWPLWVRVSVVGCAAVLLLTGVAVGVDFALSAGKVHPGVRVGSVAVGGLTHAEATDAIAAYLAEQSVMPVSITAADTSWDVTAESLSLSVDSTTLAEGAYSVGRGSAAAALAGRLRAIFGGVTVPLRLECDPVAVSALVQTINETVATPAINADVEVEGSVVTRIDPADGVGVDVTGVREEVLDAFLASDRSVRLELGPISPEIDEAATEDAYQDALAMVSAPVVLYYEAREWEAAPDTIGGWIGFRRAEGVEPPVLEAYIASEDVSATVLPMVAEVGKLARDAGFTVSNGTVAVVPAEDGLQADAAELATRLDSVLLTAQDRRAELTMHRVDPEITTAEAQAMGIVERLSTFTTDFSSGNKPRVNNIHTLTDALEGTLIPPGGVFSFNDTIGPRTAAKGYEEANAIVNGKLVPQLGGGICQVNTTVFNAVFFSGLPVVERKNHSQYISHYPTGRDATVSWGGPDFKFKNDTPNWVLVATAYTNSTVTISLYGTKPGYEVTYDTGPWTDLKDPPVREVPDATLPAGSRVVEERGVSGRTIVVVRHVKQNGVEIRTDSFKSVYRPAEEVVRVGTKVTTPSSPTTTGP